MYVGFVNGDRLGRIRVDDLNSFAMDWVHAYTSIDYLNVLYNIMALLQLFI